MKKSKWIAFLLSMVLMAQPVIYASAQSVADTSDSYTDTQMVESENEESVETESAEIDSEVLEADTIETSEDDTQAIEKVQDTVAVENTDQIPEGVAVGGYIPSDLDYNTPVYNGNANNGIALYADEVPAAYPSDGIAGIQRTYPVSRDQNPYGSCWAFSSLGLAEFDLISKGQMSSVIDLSELQLAYFTFNFVQDPLGGTAGDTAKFYNENYSSANGYLNYGGNYEMAMRRLGQWISPTDESKVPYSQAADVLKNGLDDSYAYDRSAPHLENAYLINIKENADDVKKQIMEHGAVGTMYDHLYAGATYKGTIYSENADAAPYNAYYDTTSTARYGGSHAVMIVGWDDHFSKDNFMRGEQPSSDGAWLIRNSWGEGAYNFDYFWMSYETYSLADTAYVFDFETNDGYDNNYQLDGGLQTYAKSSPDAQLTAANIFEVQKKAGVKSEELEAVSLSFTQSASVNYTIAIYTDLLSSQPTYGTAHPEATTSGTTSYAGVYTIPLNQAVELQPGTKYSVVVTIDKGSKIDCEEATSIQENPQAGGTDYIWKQTVSQWNYKSYYRLGSEGAFQTTVNNFRIKAFSTNNPYSINYELSGGINNENNPTTCGSDVITLVAPTREGCNFEGWYTDTDYKTPITEIPANASQDYTLYAKWSSVTGEAMYGHSLTLDGTTGVNFYMDLPDEVVKNTNAYVEFTLPNGSVTTMKVADAKIRDGHYGFSCGVAAKEMGSEVTARMVVDGQRGEVYTYSVKEYAETVLLHQNEYPNLVNLAKSMLNYGASAQQMFNYHIDNLANNSLSENEKALSDVDFSDYKYSLENGDSVPGLHYYGSSLSLESDTSVNDYFMLDTDHSIDEYQFKVTTGTGVAKEAQPVKKVIGGKDYYYVEIANIKAQNLNQDIVIQVKAKNDISEAMLTLHYGPFSYAEAVSRQASSNVNLVNMTKALYQYWVAARKFVDTNTGN